MSGAGVDIDVVLCRGGMDMITPTMSLANSFCRNALNWEASVTGGYGRIAGYERFDGRPSPTDNSKTFIRIKVYGNDPMLTLTLGSTVTNGAGATGTLAYYTSVDLGTTCEYYLTMVGVTGSFANGNSITVGASLIGNITDAEYLPSTPLEQAVIISKVADYYRTAIQKVPGSGPIRGVVEFDDTVYAFRDNVGGTACDIYKSSTGGWVNVPLDKMVRFIAGGTFQPDNGDTLNQGGAHATIERVVTTAGEWQAGDAEGYFVISGVTGGPFTAAAASVTNGTGTTTMELTGAETQITLLPGGRFEFDEHNFGGQGMSNRVYGCDGVNKAFEFGGSVLVPIETGATIDAPSHITAHKNHLFVSIGGSVMHSAPGLPYNWTALSGASEIATGGDVTGIISMPGGTGSATLGITNRSNTLILYGNSVADWNLVSYNTGTGALAYSLQNMAQTYAFDDRGLNAINTSLQYGNFTSTTLTNQVLPFINKRINLLTASVLCRRKSQYRMFFSDGYGLFVTVVNGKLLGCMPTYFPHTVACTYEGKKNDGTDVMYFGGTDGYVYQMEKGTSFDGQDIPYNLTMNFSNAKSPRTLKRYRKCVPELYSDAGSYAEFKFSYMLGYDSPEYSQPTEDQYDHYGGTSRWDSFIWDSFFWDSHDTDFIECQTEGTAENIAILIDGKANYVPPFTINSFLIHYSPRRLMR